MFVFFFMILAFFSTSLQASLKPGGCFECHDAFKKFNHSNASCIDCHKDVADLPHKEKLGKPLCIDCHKETSRLYNKSIHNAKGLSCKECHDTHFLDKDRKGCIACHGVVTHKTLPSKEKHLKNLGCAICHGRPINGKIEAELYVNIARGAPIQRSTIDRDGNNLIDKIEWDFLLQYLKEKHNGAYTVQRSYTTHADVHNINKAPVQCGACHVERTMIKETRLKISGVSSYTFRLEPGLLIPELPAIARYKQTVHGKKGIACFDCHISQERINDSVCMSCHEKFYTIYKNTPHAKKGATQCTDCHDPHKIVTYRQHSARQRIEVCARCHKDYAERHAWLPNSLLHFNYLECSTCHSPNSTKSIVFFFGQQQETAKQALSYEDIKGAFGQDVYLRSRIDRNNDSALVSQEISDFFLELREKYNKNLYIGASIIITEPYHDYSVKRSKEKVCTTCHSAHAPFYDSMYLILPEKTGNAYIPVKGTILGAAPIAVFTDLCLLGEERVTMTDMKKLLRIREKGLSDYPQALGFKWIDILGIAFIGVILIAIMLHIIARIFLKR